MKARHSQILRVEEMYSMNVIWVNDQVSQEHNDALARDEMCGVDGELLDVVEIANPPGPLEGIQAFIYAGNGDGLDAEQLVPHLEAFVAHACAQGDLRELGSVIEDFWPDGVGINEGYDVRLYLWDYFTPATGHGTLYIYRLDPDPS